MLKVGRRFQSFCSRRHRARCRSVPFNSRASDRALAASHPTFRPTDPLSETSPLAGAEQDMINIGPFTANRRHPRFRPCHVESADKPRSSGRGAGAATTGFDPVDRAPQSFAPVLTRQAPIPTCMPPTAGASSRRPSAPCAPGAGFVAQAFRRRRAAETGISGRSAIFVGRSAAWPPGKPRPPPPRITEQLRTARKRRDAPRRPHRPPASRPSRRKKGPKSGPKNFSF